MMFRSEVEPPEPMRGLEVPPEVVEALGGGTRPRVRVTLNGHSWSTRIAIMRGRDLIGLSKANRAAAGVAVGDQVEVDLILEAEPVAPEVPADLASALDGDPAAREAYQRLTVSQQRQQVRVIEAAKKPETRAARIAKAVAELSPAGRPRS